jgi:hypothetical protein
MLFNVGYGNPLKLKSDASHGKAFANTGRLTVAVGLRTMATMLGCSLLFATFLTEQKTIVQFAKGP